MFLLSLVFFFNDTATTEIYTLSLHDALPICTRALTVCAPWTSIFRIASRPAVSASTTWSTGVPDQCPCTSATSRNRSEEHTSELQSRQYLVCRLLLEKKK